MLTIKPLELKDLELFYDFYRGKGYEAFFRHFPKGLDLHTFEQYALVLGGALKAVDTKSGRTSGYIVAHTIPDIKQCELGVLVPKKIQQRGLGLMITKTVADTVFNTLNYNRLVMITLETDIRTNDILLKGGLTKEGITLQTTVIDETLYNEVRWSLDKDTYIKLYKG